MRFTNTEQLVVPARPNVLVLLAAVFCRPCWRAEANSALDRGTSTTQVALGVLRQATATAAAATGTTPTLDDVVSILHCGDAATLAVPGGPCKEQRSPSGDGGRPTG